MDFGELQLMLDGYGAGAENVEEVFCQNFTAGVPGIGETLTVPLKDDGEDVMVTEDNRREFVDLYVDYYLNAAIHKQVWLHSAPAAACTSQDWSILHVMVLFMMDEHKPRWVAYCRLCALYMLCAITSGS